MATVFEVRDEVREVVEPLLPDLPAPSTGRPRVPDRVAFNAIVFVLVTGVAWRFVPQKLGCSGVTAWRRLRDWQQTGVWERLHQALVAKLRRRRRDRLAGVGRGRQPHRALQRGPNWAVSR